MHDVTVQVTDRDGQTTKFSDQAPVGFRTDGFVGALGNGKAIGQGR